MTSFLSSSKIFNLGVIAMFAMSVASFTLPDTNSEQRPRGFTIGTSSSTSATELSSTGNRREAFTQITAAAALATGLFGNPTVAAARLEGVNRPDLLPSESGKNVIQIEKFLTNGQAKRMDEKLAKLEEATGFRVRVLCQAYPQTPGSAIKEYWKIGDERYDDRYVVLVVDQFGGKGNVLNFNVGEGVKFALPNVFWTRLQGKFGSVFFVKENGIDSAIESSIDAIYTCLRSEEAFCVNVPDAAVDLQTLK